MCLAADVETPENLFQGATSLHHLACGSHESTTCTKDQYEVVFIQILDALMEAACTSTHVLCLYLCHILRDLTLQFSSQTYLLLLYPQIVAGFLW